MIDLGKKNILGVLVDPIDYETAIKQILDASQERKSFAVSALAGHGVMMGVLDPEQRYRLNHLDLVVPDVQPVRWALNLIHRANLRDRVYGPKLTLGLCQRAAQYGSPIYLYGSTTEVLRSLQEALQSKFPQLAIVGA